LDICEEVKERLSIFKNLYDVIRIIDPVNKKAIISKNDNVEKIESPCYRFWGSNSSCKNCISMRAYIEQDTFTKFEYINGKIFSIIATPIKFRGKEYILEMIKEMSVTDLNIDGKGDLKDLISALNEKIITDYLTNVYNRRYINERLPVDIDNSIKIKKPISIVIADLDSFKQINDDFGHVMGDIVLKDTCKIIKDFLIKNEDWVGRYGGDEFLIVLNNINREEAYKIIESMRIKIEKHKFKYNDKSINITVSFGIYTVDSQVEFNAVIEELDKNLYKAKKHGKNRIVV